MDLHLRDQVAVVTGGASGIGAATVRALAAEGCRVSIWDLRADDRLADHLQIGCDITNPDSLSDALQKTEELLGPVDIVVHAAAIGSGHFGFPFTNVPPDAWRRVLEVNIMGMVNVAHLLAPHMRARNTGSFVFVSSVAGQMGSQTDPPYSASKAANINFAQCMAKDLASSGVRVNSVCPGMVKTPLNESVWRSWAQRQDPASRKTYDEWAAEKISSVIPLKRWQTVDDIAAMIVFLSSPRCSEVTGQTINVDGGCVMHW